MIRRAGVAFAFVAMAACAPTTPGAAYVTPWAAVPYARGSATSRPPREATRLSAYMAVAMYEAYAGDAASGLSSLGGQLNGLWRVPSPPTGGVDGATAAASAAAAVLMALDSTSGVEANALLSAQILKRRKEHVGEPLRGNSLQFGQDVARAIVAWSEADGLASVRRRLASAKPPKVMADSDWGSLRTFVLRNADECAAPAIPTYGSRAGADYWKVAKIAFDSTSASSADAETFARFWAEDTSAGLTTASRWSGIMRSVATTRGSSAAVAVEAFVRTAVAMADADVGARRQPALSTSSTVAGAASEVLARSFGDSAAFQDSVAGVGSRRISGFSQARAELATAAVPLGIQRFPSIQQGLAVGLCTGQRVSGRLKTTN